ncbi:DsrE family protein [Parabacteroides sp. FAFU027]|uniref:DsrE family protein n=1 Tax=Parabacteroides sp. FAFU027 TaxID=2922715 RepID=UPI00293F3EC1|nr:DsrE family protein [Parabacteroides sp. FAFU027]
MYSNDTETVWNAMRFANFAKNEGDTISIFLLGKGVEVEKLTEKSKEINEQVDRFLDIRGKILGCGTCLQKRNNNEPKVCKFSSMQELYNLTCENKTVLTF